MTHAHDPGNDRYIEIRAKKPQYKTNPKDNLDDANDEIEYGYGICHRILLFIYLTKTRESPYVLREKTKKLP